MQEPEKKNHLNGEFQSNFYRIANKFKTQPNDCIRLN